MTKPENANEECVGPESEAAGTASGCQGCPNQGMCSSGELKKQLAGQSERDQNIARTLSKIRRVILVLSGKGGVGKSTCSAQLAFTLSRRGYKVGLLDVDICGPSIPLMLGVKGHEVHQSASGWSPVYLNATYDSETDATGTTTGELAVMSIGFLVPNEDSAIIWRGPKKNGLIEQFFTTVDWGELDYLIVDTPPGTSDEHISIVQMLKSHLKPNDGAVVVSTPQEVAMSDVRKELNFCKTTGLKVLGVVENMSSNNIPLSSLSFVRTNDDAGSESDVTASVLETIRKKCPELLHSDLAVKLDIFGGGVSGVGSSSVRGMANKFGVEFLGSVPLDKSVQQAGDMGKALSGGVVGRSWNKIVDKLIQKDNFRTENNGDGTFEGMEVMNGDGVIIAG